MLAKLIVHAENRETAAKKMQAALLDFVVHGVVTNIDFLQDVLAHPDFANGKVSTRWVETNFNWTPPSKPSFESLIAASLTDIVMPGSKSQVASSSEFDPYNPWKNPSGFRN
jgi:acetyl/propionyl-CoA carboxylase alpha subunit